MSWKTIFGLFVLIFVLFSETPLYAYNFSWSTHEDITRNDPPNPPGECNNCECEGPPVCRKGSPVYLKTGHLTWQESDIVLPGRPALSLERSYSSHEPRTGLFGNGWISNFERALIKTIKTKNKDDGTGVYRETYYIFRHPNGLRYTFKELADGSLEVPAGIFQSITKISAGSYSFNYPDGSVEIYKDGNMVLREDKNGNGLHLYYDDNGLLQKIQGDAGSSLSFFYGANGYVATVQDHTGRNWSYNYDLDGNLTEVVNPLGGSRSFSYEYFKPSGDAQVYYQLTNITDASGVDVINVTYNGEVVSSYTEGQNSYDYSFDFYGQTATKTDSTGSRYGFNLDVNGLLTRLVDPLGKATIIERNDNLVKTGTVDKAGNRWERTVDEKGRVLTITSPLNQTTSYEYSGDNPYPLKVTSALGHITTLTYDSNYNITSLTNALGAITQLILDGDGNITSITNPLGGVTSYTYDSFSSPVTITDPLGRTTTYSYDELGRIIALTDAENRTSRFVYDELSRLIRSINALGHVVEYDYDASGRLLGIQDSVGNITSYSYDAYGRLLEETLPDGGKNRYSYNSDNTVSRIVRADSTTLSYSYDAAKQLLQTNVDGDINSYTYDARGYLIRAQNNNAVVNFSYDAAGRMLKESQNNIDVLRSYDMDNFITSLSYADESVSYVRDAIGFAKNITSSLSADTFTFGYDANGALLSVLLPNNLSNQWSYNAAYGLIGMTSGSSTINYSHDATGLITNKVINGVSTAYSYDAGQRLVAAGGVTYKYDIAGNVQSNNATFASVNNRLLEDDEFIYSYSLSGNLRQKQNKLDNSRKVYTWNSRNQLLKVESFDNLDQLTQELSFTYGPLGRRLSNSVNNQPIYYLYDNQDIVAIFDESQNLISTFVHSEYTDTPLSITTGDQTYYYHRDHLGSIISLTDASQSEVESYSYNSYGLVTASTQTEVTNNPYGFTGREYDDTDLYYYRARYYDPTIQRFLSEDPIGFLSGDYNFYRYVLNDPVNFVDPWGLARRQKRPLNIPGLKWGTYGPLRHDTFKYDNGSDSGYFDDNGGIVRPDTAPQSLQNKYETFGRWFDDNALNQAEQNVQKWWLNDPYSLDPSNSHQCQDYADRVEEEYDRITKRWIPSPRGRRERPGWRTKWYRP